MSDFLNDYKAYYEARAKRAAARVDYPLLAKAEADLNNAMQSCNELSEFKDKIGNLNELCAVALVKDKYALMHQHFVKEKEDIRALGPERIIAKADQYDNVLDLMTMINEEENKNSIEISMDDTGLFHYNWFLLERIEVYEKAVVPDKWKKEMESSAEENWEAIRKDIKFVEENNDKWQSGWKFNPALIWEPRHKRMLPYPDSEIETRINQFNLINR